MAAAIPRVAPNTALPASSSDARGVSRRAAKSAPLTDPMASIEVSRPNSWEPAWNTLTAMAETNTGKLIPNVITRKSIQSTVRSSGRSRT